ncbi:PREDICTED: high affinity copper uptake protein 1 isoform X2 [Dinoponera quadriceps]|uniref:Copper transport protein n=1 Tax=Dinoponera quadriceps TaxID=609295 RepID=A0A6P3XRZ8_DINQU|nr:PREDICTED: high affinity copper uptake protein 1 isoform X2 [Dinoponera quadriceps]
MNVSQGVHAHMAHNVDHGSTNHGSMDHGSMNHGSMDHGAMNHGDMDHGSMNHANMDHGSHGSMHQVASSMNNACGDSSMHGHGMSMTFHTGFCESVLFSNWKITSVGGLVGSMIGIIILAALYEGLKYYREYLLWKEYNSLQYRSVTVPNEKNAVAEDNRVVQPTMLSWMHSFQTLLHLVQMVLSYFLMLIFMTYNVWLCCAVVLGAAIGYFLFGWKKSVIVDVTEHCH